MIWSNNIDATAALYQGVAERWHTDARERRVRRLNFGGSVVERH